MGSQNPFKCVVGNWRDCAVFNVATKKLLIMYWVRRVVKYKNTHTIHLIVLSLLTVKFGGFIIVVILWLDHRTQVIKEARAKGAT